MFGHDYLLAEDKSMQANEPVCASALRSNFWVYRESVWAQTCSLICAHDKSLQMSD